MQSNPGNLKTKSTCKNKLLDSTPLLEDIPCASGGNHSVLLTDQNNQKDVELLSSNPSELHHLECDANGGGIDTESWNSFDSVCTEEQDSDLHSEHELLKMKENLSLEILWISQAITSRKSYLQMKNGMC